MKRRLGVFRAGTYLLLIYGHIWEKSKSIRDQLKNVSCNLGPEDPPTIKELRFKKKILYFYE